MLIFKLKSYIAITSTYTDNMAGISSSPKEAKRAKEELGWQGEGSWGG